MPEMGKLLKNQPFYGIIISVVFLEKKRIFPQKKRFLK